jgi:hypothetical protein
MSLKSMRFLTLGLALAAAAPAMAQARYDDRDWHRNLTRYGIDRNRDGVITRAEWRGNTRSFRNQDRNRDGVVSAEDRYWGGDRVVREVPSAMGRWDYNRDGVVSVREWRGDRYTFRSLDLNRDGVLTSWELRRY